MEDRPLFSSKTDEWSTPQWLFDELDAEFHFTLDAAASDENHKCDRYYTKENDGLLKDWEGETVFVNPPYSRISDWVYKAHHEGCKDNTTVVMTIPARTDTKYFHNCILHRSEIRFIKGRLRFNEINQNAPFPSLVVVFRGCYMNKNYREIELF